MATQIKIDARDRAFRTFLQGLATDLVVAVAAAALVWLPAADLASSAAWAAFGLSLTKTVLTTVASYLMRLRVDPVEPVGPIDRPRDFFLEEDTE